jgi:tetratricopeptide (TPR) repeat protein
MHILQVIDPEGEISRVGLEAMAAFGEGDTTRSAQLYKQAGEMLEAAVTRLAKASEQDHARFFAATHYYKGGAYQDALRICDQIRPRRLPARVRSMYPPFLKDVEERSAPEYLGRYRRILEDNFRDAIARNDAAAAQKVIDVLKDHQYILPHPFMAYVRAVCCEIVGKRRAATLFYREAWGFEPENPHYLLGYLDGLCKEGRRAEAWSVIEERLEKHPGIHSSIAAMSVLNASLEHDRAAHSSADERRRQEWQDELLNHFDSALQAAQSMSPGERRSIASLIDRAFLIACIPYREVNGARKSSALIDRWIALSPDSPHARTLGDMLSSPDEAPGQDVREGLQQAEDYVHEYSTKRFEEMSPILDASLV